MSKKNFEEAIAPYNFVGLPSRVIERYSHVDELPAHDQYDPSLNHGTIEYTLQADSALLIGGETVKHGNETNKYFFRNANGKPAVPGSSLRGLIRSNVGILGLSSPIEDIQDQLFLYRGLADQSKKLRNEYTNHIDIKPNQITNRMEPGKVKAGYIYQKKKDEYVIVPAEHERGKTFFKITEMQLRRLNPPNVYINYMYTNNILDYKKNKYNNGNDHAEQKRWENHLKQNKNRSFQPYTSKISFDLKIVDNNISIKDIKKAGQLEKEGYLLCSGFMQKKNSHYVINQMNQASEEVKLSTIEVRAYKEDLVRKKMQKNQFYTLPDKIGIQHAKPIFYADGGERTYFGYTPYLRVFYNGTIHDGIASHLKEEKLDYTRALFGFANANIKKSQKSWSYKSRLSFSDAVLVGEERKAKVEKVVLGEPKATCFPHYLEQPVNDKHRLKNYNDIGNFSIRGIKQYWLQNRLSPKHANKPNVDANIHPLDKGTTFKGKIHFYNLTNDELGLLLWAIQLNEGCKQNIGMAKPYGYGKVIFTDLTVKLEDTKQKYQSFSFDFTEEKEPVDLINEFKSHVKNNYQIDIDSEQTVKEFFVMKSNELSEADTRYMTLNNPEVHPRNEFAHRAILPTVFEKISGKKKPSVSQRNNQQSYNQNKRSSFNSTNKGKTQHQRQKPKQVYSSSANTSGSREKTALEIALENAKKQ